MSLLSDHKFVILGGGGHACVIADLIQSIGSQVAGFVTPNVPQGQLVYQDLPSLGSDAEFAAAYAPENTLLALGVGDKGLRQSLYQQYSKQGFGFPSLVHPSAWLSPTVQIGEGTQVMAGSIVQARSVLGIAVIVNTQASVDHDAMVGDFTHIAPGAVLCGSVQVGTGVHIGAGATVIQEISLSADTFIKAGICVKRSQ
ncbi:acetyltransferase [Reinekea blandensis]|uniref:Acetyltransferase (Isoleucine patch superfamily) protein n=1 Tax=Reinekea blandensis MED297 TaxID=314283 RepID=A4BEN0_9GAMM|nr:acetyltransferase [Reinekea blandensis]EAR09457.1 Acetyltransferase (isoleucine patch superfamily) protein [Reinekea sp. MED297] [Reinekea blandensis MED297]